LTNHPPLEARELFLHPDRLVPPRELNPEISARTERAILWAMNLHPDERPQDVATFRQALLGDAQPITRPRVSVPAPSLVDLLTSPVELSLMILAGGLLVISLLMTLLR
jgi:serine/threonine-protein kinase